MTVGMFDGVHRGHQHLIRTLQALGGRSVVLTFLNHPGEILGSSSPDLITPPSLKEELLREQKIDEVIMMQFTSSFAEMTYDQFLESYPIQYLVLGTGAALGKGRRGSIEALRFLGKRRGFEVVEVAHLQEFGEVISSSRIRILLKEGRKDEAEQLLGWSLKRRNVS
jgi:riboflavin kinase/FMN adenylyltransferase